MKAKAAASKDEADSQVLWDFLNFTAKEYNPFGPNTILVDVTADTPVEVVEDVICTMDVCPDGTSRDPEDCLCHPTKLPFDPRDWQALTKKPSKEETKRLALKIYHGVDVNND